MEWNEGAKEEKRPLHQTVWKSRVSLGTKEYQRKRNWKELIKTKTRNSRTKRNSEAEETKMS